jgi:hypothetical protein
MKEEMKNSGLEIWSEKKQNPSTDITYPSIKT